MNQRQKYEREHHHDQNSIPLTIVLVSSDNATAYFYEVITSILTSSSFFISLSINSILRFFRTECRYPKCFSRDSYVMTVILERKFLINPSEPRISI